MGKSDLISTFKCFVAPKWTRILKDFQGEGDINKSLERKRSNGPKQRTQNYHVLRRSGSRSNFLSREGENTSQCGENTNGQAPSLPYPQSICPWLISVATSSIRHDNRSGTWRQTVVLSRSWSDRPWAAVGWYPHGTRRRMRRAWNWFGEEINEDHNVAIESSYPARTKEADEEQRWGWRLPDDPRSGRRGRAWRNFFSSKDLLILIKDHFNMLGCAISLVSSPRPSQSPTKDQVYSTYSSS